MITIFKQYVSHKNLFLVTIETLLILAALICAAWLRFWDTPAGFLDCVKAPGFVAQAFCVAAGLQISFYYSRISSVRDVANAGERLASLVQSLGAGCLALGAIYYFFPSLLLVRGVLYIGIFVMMAFVFLARSFIDRLWEFAPRQNILIMGVGAVARSVAREISLRHDLKLHLVGFVDPQCGPAFAPAGDILGSMQEIEQLVNQNRVSRIIVAVDDFREWLPSRESLRLRMSGVRMEDAHFTLSALTGKLLLENVPPNWFAYAEGFRRTRLTMKVKRLADICAATVGFLICLPLMLAIAALILLDSGRPVFYWQTRVGLRGMHFKLFKFRTMRADAEKQSGAQWACQNDPRVTRIGRTLRKYRLDEMPQFVNIIRGDMSCVGPRPERPAFVEKLRDQIDYYDERHLILPGLTGWAQVQYSYGSSVDDAARKLEYDLFYLKNVSFLFDLAIVFRTLGIVARGQGAR